MDSRTAAHTLSQISELLELAGEGKFKARAYERAAQAITELDTDDLAPMLKSGEIEKIPGIGPATLSVIKDLVETGTSSYLEKLQEDIPDGVREMLSVPGLGPSKVHMLYTEMGIASVDELEEAARDGRLNKLSGFGEKTSAKILKGIEFLHKTGSYVLFYQGHSEAERLLKNVLQHPKVEQAEIAGSIRRCREIVQDVDIVAACTDDPAKVAESFTRGPGVKNSKKNKDGSVTIDLIDGVKFDLYCVPSKEYGSTLWRQTGNEEHVNDISAAIGKSVDKIKAADEKEIYKSAGMQFVPAELREGMGEVKAAQQKKLPKLIEFADVKGILHCHSTYSDGKNSIEEMAKAAKSLGWSYIGISDHSQAAFYAGGLKPDDVKRQHEEIDKLNAKMKGFKILKGIEADILQDGSLDYEDDVKATFDYIIGSIHNRFKMDKDAMTERVLRAMDDPYLTILSHPTGRLLLSREPFEMDMDTVFKKAVKKGVAIEANGDPQRMDLDWRYIKRANELGVTIEIGPDAHSTNGLHNTVFGVNMARKGWTEAKNVLNTRSAADIIKFAKARL